METQASVAIRQGSKTHNGYAFHRTGRTISNLTDQWRKDAKPNLRRVSRPGRSTSQEMELNTLCQRQSTTNFTNSKQNSPLLQQMLKMLPSRLNILSLPTGHVVVNSLDFFPGKADVLS